MLKEEALKLLKSNLPASLGKNKEKRKGWQMQKNYGIKRKSRGNAR
jgi:hypothetical protein